ncbi:hypothetical protein [Priestia taiwanensis]|uniref:Uncharacterized protein n=1 Tax=Priestia taiwanensis TaxID=1347902 RepID=A0A917AUT9_9BACI|nr:hypothetical protein [Priestia taiwanensis]MBM7364110.1 hypothetical protein [Priestia taiwanensis]GGE71661.1 hypothetical protein GCM10007140_22030 [Priestia taiwanensis]
MEYEYVVRWCSFCNQGWIHIVIEDIVQLERERRKKGDAFHLALFEEFLEKVKGEYDDYS